MEKLKFNAFKNSVGVALTRSEMKNVQGGTSKGSKCVNTTCQIQISCENRCHCDTDTCTCECS